VYGYLQTSQTFFKEIFWLDANGQQKQCGCGIRTCKTANSKSAQTAFGDLLHEMLPLGDARKVCRR
jgi:hypothetical protein